ncbi:MAG: DUF4263 domain-containing protein [Rhodospirillales bacterium]|nr:DUF4263 domain-containing protein [Rhodospirillales bacterium]
MNGQDDIREELRHDLKTKEVYHFVNGEEGVDVRSKEIFKKKHEQIHYPFYRDGKRKYSNIDSIQFVGVSPDDLRGVSNRWQMGYGFTANLAPIIYYLEKNHPQISKIIISRSANSAISEFEITFNAADLDRLFARIKPLKDQHSGELKLAANNALSEILPDAISKKSQPYFKGQLARLISDHQVTSDDLSKQDVETILNVVAGSTEGLAFETREAIFSARDKIDRIYIEAVEEEFSDLLKQKTETSHLEGKWQEFFSRHTWIFSHLFAFPTVLFQEQAYMGGKSVHGIGGKFADFLYKNEITDNVAIAEIKTHKSKLLEKSPYRGDDVFAPSKELSGAISQVLNQKDNLQKKYIAISDENDFKAFDPECLLVVGSLSQLTDKQQKSFELYRRNSSNVQIVTFDEVHQKMKLLLDIFTDSDTREDAI